MFKEIIGQILGTMGMAATCWSYLVNKDKLLLIIQTTATALICVSYYFLGATSGFALNIVCVIRNLAFFFFNDKEKLKYAIGGVCAVGMIVLGALSWQGFVSLFIIIALAVNTVFLSLGKPQILRISVVGTSSSILIYNIFMFSVGGIFNEAIAIVSSIIGIILFYKKKNKEVAYSDVAHANLR